MSFVMIKTVKGETLCLNCGKILFFCESKKGSTIFMEDGSSYEMNISLKQLFKDLNGGNSPFTGFET